MLSLTEKLERWVAGGGHLIGEVEILREGECFRLLHVEDRGRTDLETFSSPAGARAVVRYDDSGKFRPLKSAPGLRHGWELILEDAADLREALDYIYPAAIGIWFGNAALPLEATSLRDVLGRQTGMYRAANQLSDAGAQALVGEACSAEAGCLKRVCWPLTADQAIESLPCSELGREPLRDGEMPLLCFGACNLLVAAARKAAAEERAG